MASSKNLGTAVLTVAWTFNGLTTAVIVARYYARLKIMKKLTVDDGIILLALALGLGSSICLTISASWGLGLHVKELSADQIIYSMKWIYIGEAFAILSPCIGRIAYAFLLLSLVPPIPWRSRLLWGIICMQFVIDCGAVIISFAQCRPMRKYWDHSVSGSCWPPNVQRNTGYFQSCTYSLPPRLLENIDEAKAMSCGVDFVLAIFPASMFLSLNMTWKKKLSLSFLMGLGIFAMVASVVKTIQLRVIAVTDDRTYAMADLAICATLEEYIVIIAASIPTLRPIVTAPRQTSSVGDNYTFFVPRGRNGDFESISDLQLLDRNSSSRNNLCDFGEGSRPEEGISQSRKMTTLTQ